MDVSEDLAASSKANGRDLRSLTIASVLEACTLLLLLGVAVPLKHLAGWPLGVKMLGPIHGLAVLWFGWTAVQVVANNPRHWSALDKLFLIGGALVPFGGFLNVRFIRRKAAAAERA